MTKSTKKAEKETKSLFNIYGARVSKSGKYANISIVKNTGDDREFEAIPVDIEGKKVAVREFVDSLPSFFRWLVKLYIK